MHNLCCDTYYIKGCLVYTIRILNPTYFLQQQLISGTVSYFYVIEFEHSLLFHPLAIDCTNHDLFFDRKFSENVKFLYMSVHIVGKNHSNVNLVRRIFLKRKLN